MAKGKSGSGVKKVSAGGTTGRPSRKITNAIKRDRRKFIFVDMQTIRSMTAHEDFYRELAKRRDQKSKDQYAKYLEKQSLMIDAIMGTLNKWNLVEAKKKIKYLNKYKLFWLEEPLPTERTSDYKIIKKLL